MAEELPPDSVGIVTPQSLLFNEPLEFGCGRVLDEYQLVVETYGTLNDDASNAILMPPKTFRPVGSAITSRILKNIRWSISSTYSTSS